jgi:two-component system, cell cycle response regulator DivK
VVAASDGAEGIELAIQESPDLILLDIQLPRMDGYEVARALRERPTLAATPIVAVTSYAMMGDKEKALAAGCDGYLEKPINPETFVSQVESFLPGASRGGSA